MIKLILAIILASKQPISVSEIKSILFKKHSKEMAKSTIQLYLTDLMSKEKITRQQAKKAQYVSYGSGKTRYYLYRVA